MDVKDSYAVAALVVDVMCCELCFLFAGCDVPRAVFPLVDDWPLMLGIMAGMDQKDSFLRVRCARCTGTRFIWEMTSEFISVLSCAWFDKVHTFMSVYWAFFENSHVLQVKVDC